MTRHILHDLKHLAETPLTQAARCLDLWLVEEGRDLPPRLKRRAAGLIARHFEDTTGVLTDKMISGFLDHYSGLKDIDLDDMPRVRAGIREVLDLAKPVQKQNRFLAAQAACAVLFIVFGFFIVTGNAPISRAQQAQLKVMVDKVAQQDAISHASVWAKVKAPLQVRSYQDIPVKYYDDSLEILEGSLRPGM